MSTKPKKLRGLRLTKANPSKKKQKGRPKGTRKKRKFEETNLGFMLKYETPLEYNLIMSVSITNSTICFPEPNADLIETIAEASIDPAFEKPKFKRYLKEYREYGIFCDRPKILTPERSEYYKKLRNRKNLKCRKILKTNK